MKEQKTLYLNVTQQAFDVMVTGEKKFEFRRPSPWIMSRIMDAKGNPKHYDQVKVVAGYGSHRPYFISSFIRTSVYGGQVIQVEWSNGLVWPIKMGDVIIHLGGIEEVGNMDSMDDVVDSFAYAIHALETKKKDNEI